MHPEFINKIKIGLDLSLGKDKAKLPKLWNTITSSIYSAEPNYAILTGKINDLIVIDLDNKDPDFIGLHWFEKNFSTIDNINTLVTKTINNGYHIYFKYNNKLSNKINMFNLNIDILTDKRCVYEGFRYNVVNNSIIRELTDDELVKLLDNKNNKIIQKEPELLSYDELREIIMNLNKSRSSDYENWIRIGFFLYTQNDGYDIFKTFSKQSTKYNEDSHDTFWNSFTTSPEITNPITICTILMWLKEDNLKIFNKFNENKKLLKELDNTTKFFGYLLEHNKIVKKNKKEIQASHKNVLLFISQEHNKKSICHKMNLISIVNNNGMIFKCKNCAFKYPDTPNEITQELAPMIYNLVVNIKNEDINNKDTTQVAKKILLEFNDNNNDNKFIIRTPSNEWYLFNKITGIYESKAEELIKIEIDNIVNNLKENGLEEEWIDWMYKINYKENIFKELKTYCYNECLFNKKRFIIGFQNGVYDLEKSEFRPGFFDEYITMKCNMNFEEKDTTLAEEILKSTFQDSCERNYMINRLALCLEGFNREQTITFNYGFTASNGKSFLMERIKTIFGDYSGTFPVNMLTSKMRAVGDTNSTLLDFNNKRFLYCSEPESGSKLNINYIKSMTGDILKARGLYDKKEIDIYPSYHLFVCCNVLPLLDGNDNGISRRIRIVEYNTKFTEIPKKKDEKLLKKYSEDEEKIIEEGLLWILIKQYKILQQKNFVYEEPEKFKNMRNIYLNEHRDEIVELLRDSFIHGEESDFVKLKDIKKLLKDNNFKDIDTISLTHIIKSVFEDIIYKPRHQLKKDNIDILHVFLYLKNI